MVKAILDGRKSQTRRVMRSQPIGARNSHSQDIEVGDRYVNLGQVFYAYESTGRNKAASGELTYKRCDCPYGKVGDLLWVRETYARWSNEHDNIIYQDDPEFPQLGKQNATLNKLRASEKTAKDMECVGFWQKIPSIFMPKWATRIWLEITGIRVERVKEISENDAIREGCELYTPATNLDCVRTFERLWDSVNGKKYP